MGWNDRGPHAEGIESIMIELEEEEGMTYPDSYNRALEIYTDQLLDR
jgi:hypothetical protein